MKLETASASMAGQGQPQPAMAGLGLGQPWPALAGPRGHYWPLNCENVPIRKTVSGSRDFPHVTHNEGVTSGYQHSSGKTKEGGQSPKKKGEKAARWAQEIMPKQTKSLPNGRQQGGAFGAAPRGGFLLSSIRSGFPMFLLDFRRPS